MRKQKHCTQCNYDWQPRAKAPRQCPRCKRYDWKPALVAFIRHGEPNKPPESPVIGLETDPTKP